MSKEALITGVTGQDGSYLAEHLLDLDYYVIGMVRRRSTPNLDNLTEAMKSDRFAMVEGDITDPTSLDKIINETSPKEIYNLAAQSFVAASWNTPRQTNEANYLGFINLLEACRRLPKEKQPRIYQASSSEMYGNTSDVPQDHYTCMIPRSPYGVSKLAAHRIGQVYRESFGMYVACGICFNHESPRRGMEFVTRKIARGVAQIAKGKVDKVMLGNVFARRDWGYAPDYVKAMHLMLQRDEPDDFIIATGESHTVGEFLHCALGAAGLGGMVKDYVLQSEELMRPAEVHQLVGDPTRANEELRWYPSVDFEKLVTIMVEAEMAN